MKSFGPKKFQIPCTDQKVPIWRFFRQGRDDLFALGADEFLAMLEDKIREAPFS